MNAMDEAPEIARSATRQASIDLRDLRDQAEQGIHQSGRHLDAQRLERRLR